MRVFNRIFMILLLAGLFVLGVYTVVYAFDLFDYRLGSLPISDISRVSGLRSRRGGRQPLRNNGNHSGFLAAIGLLWFIVELRQLPPGACAWGAAPTSPATWRGGDLDAAEQVPDVLGSSVGVKARRSPGARVDLEARVRRGEDLGSIKSGVQSTVEGYLSEKGLPVSKLNVRLVEADPRQTKTRVQ